MFSIRAPQKLMRSSPSTWRYVVNIKSTVKILSISMVFLENMNFKNSRKRPDCNVEDLNYNSCGIIFHAAVIFGLVKYFWLKSFLGCCVMEAFFPMKVERPILPAYHNGVIIWSFSSALVIFYLFKLESEFPLIASC